MSAVAILGCGPSGLLCAWAVEQAGHEPLIYSRKEKSVIPGSQHLHGPVPGLTPVYPEGSILFVRMGTAAEYARKVYGDENRETGWGNYFQVYPSWNVLHAYDKLWEHYESSIRNVELDRDLVSAIADSHAATISTVPAWVLCYEDHQFESQEYWIKQLPTPADDQNHEIVVYNGLRSDHWYRWSILGGLCTIETTSWSDSGDDWQEGSKAIGNNCNCWPSIHRCGRWAEWTHGVTMYKAYKKAEDIMERIDG